MSMRDAMLCDVESWNNIKCGGLRIATCGLCKRDICAEHTLHPLGGVILKAETYVLDKASRQDMLYGAGTNGGVPNPSELPKTRIHICTSCRSSFSTNDIQKALEDTVDAFVKLLAAKLVEKTLSK
jgi:hypothetical protein